METLSQDQIKRLQSILQRRGSSREDAEDHVQEALARLYQYTGEVRNVEAFVCTTAINDARNAWRRRNQCPTLNVDDFDVEDPLSRPEMSALASIRLEQIQELLDAVSVKTRTVYMAHRAGYEYREIATQLGLSMRTVEKHVMRGIAVMRGQTP